MSARRAPPGIHRQGRKKAAVCCCLARAPEGAQKLRYRGVCVEMGMREERKCILWSADAFEKSKITKILGIILYCWNSYYKDEGGLVPIIRTEIMTKRKFRRIY